MRNLMSGLAANERGATAIEYAIIAAGIAVAVLASIQALGVNVVGLFETAADAF